MTEQIGKITLDYKHYPGEDLYCDGVVEDELLAIVKEHPAQEYGRIIEKRKSWPVLYHLSPLRGNIVEWIPVEPGSKVLEVGSGCGAITGTLAKKAGELTCIDLSKKRSTINAYRHKECDNVTIHVGNFQDIEPELPTDYDYIFLIGVFEYGQGYIGTDRPYERFMQILQKHLKKNGRMVIAIENKFGLKYWAGCKEDHLGQFFAGLEDYPEGGGVRTFTRKGLEKICEAADISEYSFYYPYPDYKFMTTVYSDEYLPKVGELTNNVRNFDRDRIQLFDEKMVFDTIIREEEFQLFSNSYLLVIGKPFPIQYAKYSNDRAEQFQIRTDIGVEQGERIVEKLALSNAAKKHLENIVTAKEQLEEKYAGSRFVLNQCQLEETGESLRIEYLTGKTLEELLDERLDAGDLEGFSALLEDYVDAVSWKDDMAIADYDLIFSNIMVQDGQWTILDYEWTFDLAISAKDMTLRALYCYLIGADKRRKPSFEFMERKFSFQETQIDSLVEKELEFQHFVTGNGMSMTEIRNAIAQPIYSITELVEKDATPEVDHKKRVQVYEDRGAGFAEEQSYFLPEQYEKQADGSYRITFEVSVGAQVFNLRVDPALERCLIVLEELKVTGVTEKNINLKICKLNGNLINDNTAIFPTEDPNIMLDLEAYKNDIGQADVTQIRFSLRLMELPESMAIAEENDEGKESKKSLASRLKERLFHKK